MKKFIHVGVPTDKVMEGSIYAEGIKTHIVPPETNEFGMNTCALKRTPRCRKSCKPLCTLLTRWTTLTSS